MKGFTASIQAGKGIQTVFTETFVRHVVPPFSSLSAYSGRLFRSPFSNASTGKAIPYRAIA
jgi:hypothetical protein